MGKPAARMADTANTCNDPVDMPVGKVISTTATVLINNLPAAKQNDQVVGVDTHIVMVPSPGGPVPTPLPHPFIGKLDGGLSSSVKIEGQPAATVGSEASNTPSHIPTPPGTAFQKPPMNKAKIIMGSPNVLIGNGGGGGGGGSGGGSPKAAQTSSAEAAAGEGHRLDVKFVDKGGKPVSGVKYVIKAPDGSTMDGFLGGRIERAVDQEGDHEIALMAITGAKWSQASAMVGDKVKLIVETIGVEDGEEATLHIIIKDANFADRELDVLSSKVQSDKIEEEWELRVAEPLDNIQKGKETKGRYSSPKYYFRVEVAGIAARSGILDYKDWLDLEFKDDEGNPLANKTYKLLLPSGQVRTGKLDGSGCARVENLPPGRIKVSVDPRK